jgi:anti-anti-sigma factor
VSDQSPELLVIDVTQPSEGVYLVSLSGEMDIATGPEFTARIAELGSGGSHRVVVDLSGLTFLDSSGINALVSSARAIGTDGGEVVLAAPTPHIWQVFEIVNLSEVVTIEQSLEAALDGRIGDHPVGG